MFVVRESLPTDIDAILGIAKHLDSYNLPYDRDAIRGILDKSQASFDARLPREERTFTFVAAEAHGSEGDRIAGTSMLYAQHGTHDSPHVYLDVLQDEHYSESLRKYMVHQALLIGYNYNGPTEIGGLIVQPEFRGHPESIGKLLSYARFLYIAMYRDVFRDRILSELLPLLEEDGTSRLWKHFGKRFTDMDYREADRLSKDNKEFIKSLFPHGMVYTSLFPESVQEEIGEVGPQTKGVEKMLERIGFRYAYQIDPFDGGPHFEAETDEVTLVHDATPGRVVTGEPSDDDEEASRMLLAVPRTKSAPFRCTWARCQLMQEDRGRQAQGVEVKVDAKVIGVLGLEPGDEVWTVEP